MSQTPTSDRLETIRDRLRRFVAERDWGQFHDPKNLAMAVASEAGELLAEFRWVASENADAFVHESAKRARVELEIGDVAITLLLLCDRVGIDLFDAIERKMALNEGNYPARLAKGQSDRPAAELIAKPFSRVIAVDWSGAVAGGHDTIWLAEVVDGVLTSLENGRSRDQLTERLIELAAADPNFVVGLDFAFGLPRWFSERRGIDGIDDLWQLVAREGESWLRECEPPFWGRPGRKKPSLPADYRQTDSELAELRFGQPKSVFQIGGAGAVGTGSLRGMPQLLRLRSAGFSIWPFDVPGRPLVVEIYPRALTGVVVKSDASARERYVDEKFPGLRGELRRRAVSTEDAFDAAVSALMMWQHVHELGSLRAEVGSAMALEGAIWTPRRPASGKINSAEGVRVHEATSSPSPYKPR